MRHLYSIPEIRFQLSIVEWLMSFDAAPDPYYLRWKRHYLLKRLVAVQLREFDREN